MQRNYVVLLVDGSDQIVKAMVDMSPIPDENIITSQDASGVFQKFRVIRCEHDMPDGVIIRAREWRTRCSIDAAKKLKRPSGFAAKGFKMVSDKDERG